MIGRETREAILTRLRCGSDFVAALPSSFFPSEGPCLLVQAQWGAVGLPVGFPISGAWGDPALKSPPTPILMSPDEEEGERPTDS